MSEELDYIFEQGWNDIYGDFISFEDRPILSNADRWKQRSFQRKKRISREL